MNSHIFVNHQASLENQVMVSGLKRGLEGLTLHELQRAKLQELDSTGYGQDLYHMHHSHHQKVQLRGPGGKFETRFGLEMQGLCWGLNSLQVLEAGFGQKLAQLGSLKERERIRK